MRLNRLDLNLLVALDALLEEKKTIVVARRLNVSQSAVSGMLARLRVFFDDELLVQMGRQLELTPLGRTLEVPVRELLMHIHATLAIRPTVSMATERRQFRITASDYVTPILIPALGRRLQALAPLLTVELQPPMQGGGEGLRRGETDLLIVPEQYIDPDQPYEVLFEDTFSCVVWEHNDQVGDVLDLASFLRCSHVSPSIGRPRERGLVDTFFDDSDIVRHIAMTTHDFTSVGAIVVGTNYIGTMQTRLARSSQLHLPLRLLAPPVPVPPLKVCMQWHHNQTSDLVHRWLREQLADIAQES